MKQLMSLLILLITTPVVFAQDNRIPTKGLAVFSGDGQFKPYEFSRHAVGNDEIQLEILYSDICHSDVHHVREDWGPEEYPMVPGHEIAGRVVKVGKDVTKFKVGDFAGIGCFVNSCGHCEYCKACLEQYCKEVVWTYHDYDQFHDNEATQGGYSNNIILTEKYAIKIPVNADIKKVAPLLCAGITTYAPIKYAGVKKGDKVGVAGFGGLGNMAVQYLVKLGAEVTVFDITEEKRADAKRLGAVKYVNINNPEELKGLISETQEMLDYSVTNNLYPEVEVINADGETVTNTYKDVVDGEVKFRYVIDMKTLK